MANTGTKELILEAAEKLFATEGYHGTSIRAITKKAGVNLASVNYHFGSKEALLEALFEDRFGALNRERRERLESILSTSRATGRPPETKDVLHAFISPIFHSQDNTDRLKSLSSLIHMAHSGSDTTVLGVLVKTFQPVIDLLFKALRASEPDVPEDSLRWMVHFFIGGFTHTLRISVMHGRGIKVPNMPDSTDRTKLVEMMVSFFTAGIEARR
jgi:AcrR family transcriptional regulator